MAEAKSVHELLHDIQQGLRATKDQYNTFGKYSYRSFEGILESIKPMLVGHGAVVTASDEMVEVGGRVYVRAAVALSVGEDSIAAVAYAREAESRKGMDDSQLTGSTSSYARKYAISGLFAIDDNKDADATNTHGKLNNKDVVHFKRKVSQSLDCWNTVDDLKQDAGSFKSEAAELGLADWLTQEFRTHDARIKSANMDKDAMKGV